ncbi:sulfotransferase, partial [Bacteroidota bacterium]
MHEESPSSTPSFFILGRPRSGTTLLRVMLDAHPNVIIPPEFPIIPLLANRFRKTKQWDEVTIRQFVEEIYKKPTFGHRSIEDLRIDREELTRNLMNLLPKVDLGELFSGFNASSASVFPKKDIQSVGDKNPLYSIFIKHLLKIFPKAKFVCLVRDYRDTFCSLRDMNGTPIEAPNVALQASRWKYVVRQFLSAL